MSVVPYHMYIQPHTLPQWVQREVVARLHEDLSSSTEQLQAELAAWQGRCEHLEAELHTEQKQSMQLEQDLKARPTSKQVNAKCCAVLPASQQSLLSTNRR